MKSIQLFRTIFLILLFLFLYSCSSTTPKGETEAEILYNDAKAYVDDERYLLATEKLNLLKTQYPYSVFAKKAELMLAEIQFKQENYPEASASYIAFRDLHPNYSNMPYVVWMIAESYYKQLPDTYDRDLSSGLEAKKYYQELMRLYPNYDKIKEVQKRIVKIGNMLLNQELYVADFYFRTDVFDGAFFRYQDIYNRYTGHEKVVDQVPERMLKSLIAQKKFNDCLLTSDKLLKDKLSERTKSEVEELQKRCRKAL